MYTCVSRQPTRSLPERGYMAREPQRPARRMRKQSVAPSRLQQVLDAYEPGIEALARSMGWPVSKLSKLKNGKQNPTLPDLIEIARALNVAVSELLDPSHLSVEHMPVVSVPLVTLELLANLNRSGLMSLREAWGGKSVLVPQSGVGPKSFAVAYSDATMDGVIRPGSIVIVDPEQEEPRSGLVYLIRIGGELLFREFKDDNETPRWEANGSQKCPGIFVRASRLPIEVIGRATGYLGSL